MSLLPCSRVVFLNLCVLLLHGKLLLVSCQQTAPADQQQECLTTVLPASPGHGLVNAYTNSQKPLLDSYWYTRVFGGIDEVWTGIQGITDNNGPGWRRGIIALCRSTMIATCTVGVTENNWVSTQFISRATAQSLSYLLPIVVNVTYRFTNCDCPRMYSVHYYPRDSPSDAARQVTSNYVLLGTLSAATVETTTSLRFNLTTPNDGFYIGFQDQNSCGTVARLQVYRVICPQQTVGLAVYPETPTGVVGVSATSGCAANAALTGGTLECSPTGEWLGRALCGCVPGYQNTSTTLCEECSVGTFKSTTNNSPCSPCPTNSIASSTGATECACVAGHFRALNDQPSDPCTTPPGSPPLLLTTGIIGGTSVLLTWDPPAQTGGRSDLSYTVTYTVDKTIISINSPDSRIALIDLQPRTSYNVTVSAENGVSSQDSAGRANRTAMITVTTSDPIIIFSPYVYTVATYLLAFAAISLAAAVVGLAINSCVLKKKI